MKLQAEWRTLLIIIVTFFMMGTGAKAAFYFSDDDDYWWFVDGSPEYEVNVPSQASAYVESSWAGTQRLKVVFESEGMPRLIIGQVPKTDSEKLFDAIAGPFLFPLTNVRFTDNRTITTDRGLSARFIAARGNGPNSFQGMVRVVTFTKDDTMTYLAFIGEAKHYGGVNQQRWLKAVHSFSWK